MCTDFDTPDYPGDPDCMIIMYTGLLTVPGLAALATLTV